MENKPKRSFLRNPWVPGILLIIIFVILFLNMAGYITLPHINLPDKMTTPTPTPTPVPTATFGMKISSYICSWTVKSDKYGNKSDWIQIVSKGTAKGPVGARVELPILAWSTDKFDCGAWTLKAGALIAVGSTCVRQEGQPETTTWSVDTGSQIVTKSYWNNNRSYTAKIYSNGDLNPQKTASQTTVCR